MVVDIGGGTTDIGVISLGGIVVSQTLRIAGNTLDDVIVQHIRRTYQLLVSETAAEEIKLAIGSVVAQVTEPTLEIRGRDLVTGLPKTVLVTSQEIREAIAEPIRVIAEGVKTVLQKTPPQLAADIIDQGGLFGPQSSSAFRVVFPPSLVGEIVMLGTGFAPVPPPRAVDANSTIVKGALALLDQMFPAVSKTSAHGAWIEPAPSSLRMSCGAIVCEPVSPVSESAANPSNRRAAVICNPQIASDGRERDAERAVERNRRGQRESWRARVGHGAPRRGRSSATHKPRTPQPLPTLADAHKYGWAAKTRREWRSAYRYVRLLSDQGRVSFRVSHHPEGPDKLRNTLTAAATTALLVREGWSLAIARTPQDAALAMGSPHMSKRLARHTARPVTAADFLRDNDVRFRCGPTRRLGHFPSCAALELAPRGAPRISL